MRISLDHLCKSFDGVEVLRDITFDEEVSALAIIGPSGGGKSTLLRIIGGLETPTSGAMAVDGSPVSFDETSLRAYRATLGFVFQDGGLFHHMTALENVALPLQVVHGASSDEADDRARELLARLGLEDSLAKRPAQLSGGQKQRRHRPCARRPPAPSSAGRAHKRPRPRVHHRSARRRARPRRSRHALHHRHPRDGLRPPRLRPRRFPLRRPPSGVRRCRPRFRPPRNPRAHPLPQPPFGMEHVRRGGYALHSSLSRTAFMNQAPCLATSPTHERTPALQRARATNSTVLSRIVASSHRSRARDRFPRDAR